MNATLIDQPGVYDLPADLYHADPVPGGSLSASGARRLLPPSCPALFHHWATHGQEHRAVFDVGHAAHAAVLGVGAPTVVVDAPDWRTKAAQQARDTAYADGSTPILRADHERVQAMAGRLRAHPVASVLFSPGRGRPEQSLLWVDAEFGIWRRAMLDWLPDAIPTGRMIVPDYKTTTSVHPPRLAKALYEYGYIQ
ncbi:MAG: PD-(D/E)XK nuclease-like domain-containing protein, partial [Actinomycetes bacterium]